MLYLASEHHRRTATCPRTHVTHEPTGTEASSAWVMLEDGAQLADVAAAESDPDAFLLLQELRAAIPVAPIGVAICNEADFPKPLGLCWFHPTNKDKHCATIPTPRPMEISVVPGRDCGQPKARCPRCIEKFHPEISAVIHRHYGTQPPAPILPPAPRELSPAEAAAQAHEQQVLLVESVLSGAVTRRMPPREAAIALVGAIESLIALASQKETK